MEFKPTINLEINGDKFSYRLFETLEKISETWSQRKAAKKLGISNTVLNRRIIDAEKKLGFKLVYTTGAGSGLTPEGMSILEKHQQYLKKLQKRETPVICGGPISTGLVSVLSQHFDLNAIITSTDDLSALEMADQGLVDILVLDDPVHAFMHDLDFVPIARDHLTLISSEGTTPSSIKELENGRFVEIPNSAQRLAWNTLDQLRVDYEIVDACNSPHTALKMVNSHENLYTFLNNSFTSGIVSGSDLFAEDTLHVISLFLWNPNPSLEDFSEFILNRGQDIVEKWGFRRIDDF